MGDGGGLGLGLVLHLQSDSCSTSLVYLRFSFSQISSSRSSWIRLAKGLNRNLEHLDVRGSIILQNTDRQQGQDPGQRSPLSLWGGGVRQPADVVTDETETGGTGLLLHGPP